MTVHDLIHLKRPEHGTFAKRLYATTMLRRALRSARVVLTGLGGRPARPRGLRPGARRRRSAPSRTASRPGSFPPSPRRSASACRQRGRPRRPLRPLPRERQAAQEPPGPPRGVRPGRRAGLPHRLVLAGGAAERRAARRAAAEAAGIADRLVDLGVVPDGDVVPLLAGASALAMPSFLEGFGLPVLEAQAVGTPVVCSDRGGLPEAAGDAALFADPDDPERPRGRARAGS